MKPKKKHVARTSRSQRKFSKKTAPSTRAKTRKTQPKSMKANPPITKAPVTVYEVVETKVYEEAVPEQPILLEVEEEVAL